MTAWIKMLNDSEIYSGIGSKIGSKIESEVETEIKLKSHSELREVLELCRTPHGTVDNVMRVHSLRPSTMRGHLVLYRSVLHDDANHLPSWFAEVIASYVSILNGGEYSLANHWKNAADLIGDEARSSAIRSALDARRPQDQFAGKELAALQYAEKLTLSPASMQEEDVSRMRTLGYDDGEILEINQVICYFNYANRSLNGLGVSLAGDIVGYYKGD